MVNFKWMKQYHRGIRTRLNELTMIGTYFADGMRVMTPTNPSQENDRVKFLGGKLPGELADSELNTLVYKRGG